MEIKIESNLRQSFNSNSVNLQNQFGEITDDLCSLVKCGHVDR